MHKDRPLLNKIPFSIIRNETIYEFRTLSKWIKIPIYSHVIMKLFELKFSSFDSFLVDQNPNFKHIESESKSKFEYFEVTW